VGQCEEAFCHRRGNEVQKVSEVTERLFSPSFLVTFVALCFFVFCTFDTFSGSLSVNTFLLPSHHVPSNTSSNCISVMSCE